MGVWSASIIRQAAYFHDHHRLALIQISRQSLLCNDNGAVNAHSRNYEPFALRRDCNAVGVPAGASVILAEGQLGYITQSLGGSFTVLVDGNLFRVAGRDADALGKMPPEPLQLAANATEEEVATLAKNQLSTCYDPEIPINIVDLGLVYTLDVTPDTDGRYHILVVMTLTAAGCGMGEVLVEDVRAKLSIIPRVAQIDVKLTFDPPWHAGMMSEAARLETGLL